MSTVVTPAGGIARKRCERRHRAIRAENSFDLIRDELVELIAHINLWGLDDLLEWQSVDAVGALNFSRTAETNGDFASFDDDGHFASPVGNLEHARKALFVFQNVDVFMRNFAPRESLPGSSRVRSEIFTENKNFFFHGLVCELTNLLGSFKNRRPGSKLQVKLTACYFPQSPRSLGDWPI
jgi:hypothetical protein